MKWADLKRGDVLHHSNASYVLLGAPWLKGDNVCYRMLCLDNGEIYVNAQHKSGVVPNTHVTVERAETSKDLP